jgi:histidinol-phosphate aminotransferase
VSADGTPTRGIPLPPLETSGPPTGGISIAALGASVDSAGPVDRIVVGVGARRGVRIRDLRMALGESLAAAGVRARDVVALVTVDAKQAEPAVQELAEMLHVPLRTLSAEQLATMPAPNPSAAAEAAVGTPSVAEAAVLALGGRLIQQKFISHGVTVAIGRLTVPAAANTDLTPTPKRPLDDLHFEDLSHHGDAETAPGLVDLAVNVRQTPDWLKQRLRLAVDDLAGYPNPAAATAAVAARHGRPVEQVLLTAGAAEAFVLLARALAPHRAVVVHPQFTEPEAALNAAGHSVQRVVLEPPFVLRPELVPDDADLVFIGNPTNPTSVLHPVRTLLALARPGRVLVVDEAFMDAVPGEPATLAGSPEQPAPNVPGLVVIRSLTKTWGLAGLRIGYLLGEPALLAACREVQALWSVGSIALEAAIACTTPKARAAAAEIARTGEDEREFLLNALGKLADIELGAPPQAPFVLLRVLGSDPVGVHQRLRDDGWAVRRADTFPGLAPGWLRIAVRDRATSEAFASALDRAVHPSASGRPVAPVTIDLRDTAVPHYSERGRELP